MLGLHSLARYLVGCLIYLFLLGNTNVISLTNYVVPKYDDVRSSWHSSDLKFFASNGHPIQRIRVDFQQRRGDWISLQQISPALQKAVITSEDKRFYQHGGVDWLATATAAWSSAWGNTRGASTITMQLAAMLEPAVQRSVGGRTIAKKLDQMQLARLIENQWSKSEILEAYLNLANYKGELSGIDITARVLFQKSARSLNLRESALLAVLLRGPNANNVVLTRRACGLLSSMGRPDLCNDLSIFVFSVLNRTQNKGFFAADIAPHFGFMYLDESKKDSLADKNVINTDIDFELQKYTNAQVRQHLLELRHTGITDAAVVVLDNATGAILAYVGSSGDLSEAYMVDHARSKRQAGSTLKPFLYALALDKQYITAASLLNDMPLDLNTGGGLYIPDNYDHVFTGWVSARTALASSLNIPAVRVLTMLGVENFTRQLKQLGLPLNKPGDYYGYSLALGSADVDLLSLTNAYRALARGGNWQGIKLPEQDSDADGNRLFSAQAAWLVGDILSDRQARARTFGLDSSLSTSYWSAVKTGTSRDMRDNWTIGWSADYTVGVWVGNSAGASMRNVSGVTGAGPIWRDIISFLNQRQPSFQPPAPTGIKVESIRFANNIEPSRNEYFLFDTAMKIVDLGASQTIDKQAGTSISYIAEPVDGTILALDPDIPVNKQKMKLQANNIYAQAAAGVKWFVNGRFYSADANGWWQPQPGSFIFELRDEFDKVIDQAKVQVRTVKTTFNSRPN